MHGTLRAEVAGAIKIDRTPVQFANGAEQMFARPMLADIAKLLWPDDTAAHLASAIGSTTRAVEFYFAGDRKFSGDAVAAIIAEIMRRHLERE
jgi:hypothetical protein